MNAMFLHESIEIKEVGANFFIEEFLPNFYLSPDSDLLIDSDVL